jgi:hypothetical protein
MAIWSQKLSLAFFIIAVFAAISSVAASDDEYLLSLQDRFLATNDTGGGDDNSSASIPTDPCFPNEELTGVVCPNITLHKSQVFSEILNVKMDLNTTFDPESQLFLSQSKVYMTFYNSSEQLMMEFNYTSATENGTLLSTGLTRIGKFPMETGIVFFPTLPTQFNITHNITLLRSGSNESCEGIACDKGELHAVLGLYGQGLTVDPKIAQILLQVNESSAGVVTMPFSNTINETTYCQDYLESNTVVNRNIKIKVRVCVPGFPCFNDEREVGFGGQNSSQVLERDDCFEHQIEF